MPLVDLLLDLWLFWNRLENKVSWMFGEFLTFILESCDVQGYVEEAMIFRFKVSKKKRGSN